ncbi:hypothetical protein ANCCAN_07511 [Ancylostoma caninum]|uniref:Nematode fatty acid retinoid binding protein n=1 Tax=Ancylostoma caninum TaxID=29170 RepID=A0A368GU70_ANCCA|nr:hypothetical protein ANCCAN_07511 [Ancylostoma caninum]
MFQQIAAITTLLLGCVLAFEFKNIVEFYKGIAMEDWQKFQENLTSDELAVLDEIYGKYPDIRKTHKIVAEMEKRSPTLYDKFINNKRAKMDKIFVLGSEARAFVTKVKLIEGKYALQLATGKLDDKVKAAMRNLFEEFEALSSADKTDLEKNYSNHFKLFSNKQVLESLEAKE